MTSTEEPTTTPPAEGTSAAAAARGWLPCDVDELLRVARAPEHALEQVHRHGEPLRHELGEVVRLEHEEA